MIMLKNSKERENLHIFLSFGNLIISTAVIIISTFFPSQEIFFNIFFSPSQYFLMGIIFLFQVIFSVFIKYTSKNYPNAYLFDIFSLLIFLSLVGMISSINFLTLASFFILIIILTGMIFYFGEFKKEFRLLKTYFTACIISIISLISAILIFYFNTGTILIYNMDAFQLSEIPCIILSILLILGLGIPCGLFPFYVFHLKKYFQEADYVHVILLMAFNLISTLTIMQLLGSFISLTSVNIFIILIISGLGVVIAIYYIILEIFTSHDGFTYSIKKIIGYSIICDSNLILLLFANFYLFPEPFRRNLLNLLIFLFISLTLMKLILSYSFLITANKSNEDNFRLLGNFWKNNKMFGLLLFLSGLILIFPVIFIFIYSFLANLEFMFPMLNSLVSLISIIALSLLIISILIILLFTSHFFVQVYISKNTSYLERVSTYKINKKMSYLIGILLITLLIGQAIIYIYSSSWYFELISGF